MSHYEFSKYPNQSKVHAILASLFFSFFFISVAMSLGGCSSESPSRPASVEIEAPVPASEDEPGGYDVERVPRAAWAQYDWCRYEAIYVNAIDDSFPVEEGELFCLSCSDDGSCAGRLDSSVWFTVYRDGEIVGVVQARLRSAECRERCGRLPKFRFL